MAITPAPSSAALWTVPVLDPEAARDVVAAGGAVELALHVPYGGAAFGRASIHASSGELFVGGFAPEVHQGRQQAFCPLDVPALGQSLSWVRVRLDEGEALERVLASGLPPVPLSPPEIASGETFTSLEPPIAPWEALTFSCAFAPGRPDAVWLYGDWNGDGTREVAKYVPALDAFLLDANANGVWDGVAGGDLQARVAIAAGPGEPLVGDWNGDGIDDVGKTIGARAFLDANGSLRWEGISGGDANAFFAPALAEAVFVAGDWTGDGRDQLARFEPALGRFLLDLDGDGAWTGLAGGDGRVDFPALGSPHAHLAVEPFVADFDGAPGDGVGQAVSGVRAMADLDEDRIFAPGAGDLDYSPPDLLFLLPELPLRPILPIDGPQAVYMGGFTIRVMGGD